MAPNLDLNNGFDGFGSADSINDDFIILNEVFIGDGNYDSTYANIIEDDNAIIVSDDFFMIEDIDNTINNSDDVNEYLNSEGFGPFIDSVDIF